MSNLLKEGEDFVGTGKYEEDPILFLLAENYEEMILLQYLYMNERGIKFHRQSCFINNGDILNCHEVILKNKEERVWFLIPGGTKFNPKLIENAIENLKGGLVKNEQ